MAASSGGWPAHLMMVLIKGHPVLCSLAFIELSGAVGDAAPPAHLHHPWDRSHRRLLEKPNQHSSSNYCWWATSFYRSHTVHRQRKREKWWSGKERAGERERKRKNYGDRRAQLVEPSMLNFAKTDAELRPLCALLILATYTWIKKRLLTDWHAWINHRAVLKGAVNWLSRETWQFSLKWRMSSEWAHQVCHYLRQHQRFSRRQALFLFVFFPPLVKIIPQQW